MDKLPPPSTGLAVYASINSVMKAIKTGGISKDRQCETGGKFKYRGIDDVYNALCPILSDCNLVIIPRVLSRQSQDKPTKNNGISVYTVVEVEYDIVCSLDGSKHVARTIGEAMDSGDKSTAKAMSVAYKYLCFQLFAIPTEGDNDPDAVAEQFAQRDKDADLKRIQDADQFINGCMSQLHLATEKDELISTIGKVFDCAKGLSDIYPNSTYIDHQFVRMFEIFSNRFPDAKNIAEVKAIHSGCTLMDTLTNGRHDFKNKSKDLSIQANERLKNTFDSTATTVGYNP